KKPVQNTTLLELASYLFKIETPQILSELEEATKKPYTPQFDPQKMDIDRAALRLELERKFTSFYPFTR
ncbi:MAG: hypothetical protein ISS01_02155, partial [Nanoarchaeota archaeon]|nr:hypothetical protein [Nanoarchaeota archaeon]